MRVKLLNTIISNITNTSEEQLIEQSSIETIYYVRKLKALTKSNENGFIDITKKQTTQVYSEEFEIWFTEDEFEILADLPDFNNMSKEDAIKYCYEHEKEFVSDNNQREFDCLIEILNGTIEPKDLPSYGMEY